MSRSTEFVDFPGTGRRAIGFSRNRPPRHWIFPEPAAAPLDFPGTGRRAIGLSRNRPPRQRVRRARITFMFVDNRVTPLRRWLGTSAGIRSCCVLCRKIGHYGRLLLSFSSTFSRWGSACPCFSFTTSYTNMLFQGPVGACVLYWEEDGRHSTAPCSRAT